MKDIKKEEWEKYIEELREKLREEYRDTWKFEPTQFCLANCPSIMMIDDHEIHDDFGSSIII